MKKMNSYHCGKLRIESVVPFGSELVNQIATVILHPPVEPANRLAGRVAVSRLALPEIGPAVLKHYHRGGLIRRFLKDRYLYNPRLRCRKEFDMLTRVRRMGINAPHPLAWAFTTGLLYRCWLLTKEIDAHGNLAELSRSDPERAVHSTRLASEQIQQLICHRILHVDLHPGNVLVGTDSRVHLIDFDRAYKYRLGASRLCDRYRSRWRRAVVKHGLPEFLVAEMEAGLSDDHRAGSTPDRKP